jgi:UDP-glucose 4-epimerase
MEKILVNGGAGFIDSHVADVFLGKGYDMAILEELSAGFEAKISRILP